MENRAMIDMLSADRSLVMLAGLIRRGDGTGRKLQSVALTSLTEFPRRQSARVPARPAGKPRRRRVFGAADPARLGSPDGLRTLATERPGRRAIGARCSLGSPMRFARKW